MSYTEEWLKNPETIKMVLVECQVYDSLYNRETTMIFSNAGYSHIDYPGNTVTPTVLVEPVLSNSIVTSEKLPKDGVVSTTIGDITLENFGGHLDYLLRSRYVWTNRPIILYYGDPSWEVEDITELRSGTVFKIIFKGMVSDIGASSKNYINLKIRDNLEKLNMPVTETKIGTYGTWAGGQFNVDNISPVIFGEVHNITPILVDPATLEYRYHTKLSGYGANGVVEVRDNGIPVVVGSYQDNTVHSFRLAASPAGTITCTAQGEKGSVDLTTGNWKLLPDPPNDPVYNNTAVNVLVTIARYYGSNTNNRLTAGELDLPQLLAADTNHPYPVGVYLTETGNVLSLCQSLANSIGRQVAMSREGKLKVLSFGLPETLVATTYIADDEIIHDSMDIVERIPVTAAARVGYAKNFTVQDNLLTAIPDQHKEMYATEWYIKTAEDSTTRTNYKLDYSAPVRETLLITDAGATAEAERALDLYLTPRIISRFKGKSSLMLLQLGQKINLTSLNIREFIAGDLQVVGLTIDWGKQEVEVEALQLPTP